MVQNSDSVSSRSSVALRMEWVKACSGMQKPQPYEHLTGKLRAIHCSDRISRLMSCANPRLTFSRHSTVLGLRIDNAIGLRPAVHASHTCHRLRECVSPRRSSSAVRPVVELFLICLVPSSRSSPGAVASLCSGRKPRRRFNHEPGIFQADSELQSRPDMSRHGEFLGSMSDMPDKVSELPSWGA